jgi:deazaflavin-dependent oxidoreductase (nitroreductase family)
MIEHIGRNSGQIRRAILEVVANRAGAVYVAAGWGSESQWLKNLQANPNVSFHLGSKRHVAIAEMVGSVDARSVIEEYATAHPRAFGRLAAFMLDDPGETSQIQARRVGEIVPIVRLSKTQ